MFNHFPREIFESSKNDPALIDRRFLQVLELPRREQTTIYKERENGVYTLG